jgi:uncharacterized protein (UPF0276 family)
MSRGSRNLGLGIGWRPELAHFIDRRQDLGFVEVIAESLDSHAPLPRPLQQLRERGVQLIPHGVTLSLGGAEPIDPRQVDHLARLAEKLGSPLVSEHIAFVRSSGIEIGHLTPLPRTRESLEVLVENVQSARRLLPVPLALENIAALFDWPSQEMGESQFVTEILDRTSSLLLLDISNAYANARNSGLDPMAELSRFPLPRLAYVHMGGGVERAGIVHDTHSDPVLPGAIDLLRRFCSVVTPPGVMLEQDDHFGSAEQIGAELERIEQAIRSGMARTEKHAA